ncbi:unnamed protein product, partial [Nesidiocoris tenuis]
PDRLADEQIFRERGDLQKRYLPMEKCGFCPRAAPVRVKQAARVRVKRATPVRWNRAARARWNRAATLLVTNPPEMNWVNRRMVIITIIVLKSSQNMIEL